MEEISRLPTDWAENLPLKLPGFLSWLLAGTQCWQTSSFQYSGRCRSLTAAVENSDFTLPPWNKCAHHQRAAKRQAIRTN